MGVKSCSLGNVGSKIVVGKGCNKMWWEIDDCLVQGV